MKESVFKLEGAKINYPEQGEVYLATPDNFRQNQFYPVLLGLHSSGMTSLMYRDVDFYRFQRDIALKHGYIFASVTNVSDTWGLDDGLYNNVLLCSYLSKAFNVQKQVVIWGSSAGGVMMYRMVSEYPEMIRLAIGTFPVYDLVNTFDRGWKDAWHTDDRELYLERIKGRNPPDFVEKLANHTFIIAHGSNDMAIPIEEHSLRFYNSINKIGGDARLYICPGGGHSTTDFSMYSNIDEIEREL